MSRQLRKHRLRVQTSVEAFEPHQLMRFGPFFLKEAVSALSGTVSLGPWGGLKLVDRLETQGHHQFDSLDERLTVKFDHWALEHPTLASRSGVHPTPPGSAQTPTSTSVSTTAFSLNAGRLSNAIIVALDATGGTPPKTKPSWDEVSVGKTIESYTQQLRATWSMPYVSTPQGPRSGNLTPTPALTTLTWNLVKTSNTQWQPQ